MVGSPANSAELASSRVIEDLLVCVCNFLCVGGGGGGGRGGLYF